MEAIVTEATFKEDIYSLPKLVTIVIEKPWFEVNQQEQIQLSKILNALKLSLEKVRVVVQKDLALSNLVGSPSHVIVFGLEIKGVSFYDSLTISEVKVVLSESLSILVKNDESKKKLWLSLKPMFGL